MHWRCQPLPSCLLAAALFAKTAISRESTFDACRSRIERILNGAEEFGAINNETIKPLLYTGPVRGIDFENGQISRDNFITIKTQGIAPNLRLFGVVCLANEFSMEIGCKLLCGESVDWYWASDITLTLGIVSNWILPILALLAALPYDSLHRRNEGDHWYHGRVAKTIGVLLVWIGTPQTALTATLFNIHQIRKCFHATEPSGKGIAGSIALQPLKKDAYYVLSCIGQFKLSKVDEIFLKTLIYGLFMPICDVTVGEGGHVGSEADQAIRKRSTEWTRELLQQLAFQLRMLRRRGVYPSFLSVFLFFIAYAISIALAFSDIGERTTTHSLAFGILISWLPLFVLFSLLDRNPVSADRSR